MGAGQGEGPWKRPLVPSNVRLLVLRGGVVVPLLQPCAATLLVLSPPSNAALPASTILPPPSHATSILPPPLRVPISTFDSTPVPTKEQSPAAVRPRSRHRTLRRGSRSRSSGGDLARCETPYASGTAVAARPQHEASRVLHFAY
ncbi:hypothetical protein PVAP13_6KG080200 [Panicum virgatum]|uniref:Uncharacterized protein n=1 Tax=Panicum virgatum TaxID=38727 RepID=A0A8T0RA37_PANVG|nr:hypothetical protein PVAP13_6KG080200 [Panicum virgatum]